MFHQLVGRGLFALSLATVLPINAHAATPNKDALALQVILDRAGFSPGVIDGTMGRLTREALKGFQEAKGLKVTGDVDPETKAAVGELSAATETVEIMEPGPLQPAIPKDLAEQAKLERLGYASLEEALAERYHTSPAVLRALNPHAEFAVGRQITVPAVTSVGDAAATNDWETTLDKLGVGKSQPTAAKVVVDKSDLNVRVLDTTGKLVALFPATIGSKHDPLPIGTWKIRGVAKLPSFHYNPDLFWDAKDSDEKATIKAGPNNPVGVVWISLNLPHYGIHGTPEPGRVGHAESHGCVRLTNWDAARVAAFVKPGTPVQFR